MKQETIQEMEYRLKQLAKQSKDNSREFRYIGRGINKIVTIKNQDMITFLAIISLYVLNVFIGRYLNIKMLKYKYPISPRMWFIPLCSIIAQLIILYEEKCKNKFKFNNKLCDWFLLRHINQ